MKPPGKRVLRCDGNISDKLAMMLLNGENWSIAIVG
jgi:hypothetical protein